MATNTFDPGLILDTMSARVQKLAQHVLAPLGAFSKDFSTATLTQAGNVKVKKVTATGSTNKNPTTFTGGGDTVGYTNVTVDHYSKPFGISSKELNQGQALEDLVDANFRAFANSILDVAFAPITTANFASPAELVVAQASLSAANLKTLWGNIAKSPIKNVLLDGPAFSNFLPSDRNSFTPGMGAYGYDGMYLHTRWSGAAANAYGFACGPDALAVASGIPLKVQGLDSLVNSRIVTIPDLGISVELNLWASADSRSLNASYDIMFGAGVGDTTMGQIIATA